MISAQAKNAIDEISCRAARSRLVLDTSDDCVITRLKGIEDAAVPGQTMVVLTIASLGFRLLMLLQMDGNAETHAYYGKAGAGSLCQEAFFEVANLYCGAMNQELLRYFPDLGMSTPYALHGRCADFLNALVPGYISRHRILINGEVRVTSTLCVCENAPLDFALDLSVPETTTGELELF